MANITVHKPSQIFPLIGVEDPIRMIRELFNWNPIRQVAGALPAPAYVPAFEVRESKDRFVFRADMPGVKEADLEVTVTGNRLLIAGNRKTEQVEETDTLYAEERMFGAFTRSFVLPEEADLEHVQAALKDGVLTIVISKIATLKPRTIPVESGGKLKV